MADAWIGVLGTVLGVIVGGMLTFVFTRRNQVSKAIHDSRILAYAKFATSIMEYRRATMDRRFTQSGTAVATDGDSVYKTRSAAWAALFEVQLLARRDTLSTLAREAVETTSSIKNAVSREELASLADESRDKVKAFVDEARRDIASKTKIL